MQISVLIEPVAGDGFRASTGPPLALEAEGRTQDEALGKLRTLVTDRLAQGVTVVPLDLPAVATEKPWLPFAGMFKDNSLFDEWQQAIADYRRQRDEEDNLP